MLEVLEKKKALATAETRHAVDCRRIRDSVFKLVAPVRSALLVVPLGRKALDGYIKLMKRRTFVMQG